MDTDKLIKKHEQVMLAVRSSSRGSMDPPVPKQPEAVEDNL